MQISREPSSIAIPEVNRGKSLPYVDPLISGSAGRYRAGRAGLILDVIRVAL